MSSRAPQSARILIQQGDIDERVPLSQGTMLYRMLQELGVDVTMVVFPRSHHVPTEPKERIEVMRENVELFDVTVAPHPPLRGTLSPLRGARDYILRPSLRLRGEGGRRPDEGLPSQ